MRSTFWICISIILAAFIHGLMNRFEGHTIEKAVFVVDRITGTSRLCIVDGCYTSTMDLVTDAQKKPWERYQQQQNSTNQPAQQ